MVEPDIDRLYDDLLAMGKAQDDLHRWKAIALGAIFSVALGFADESNRVLALAGVPFVTTYVDLLIRNHDLRIGPLLRFIAAQDGLEPRFVRYLGTSGIHTARFANIATVFSSLVANIAALVLLLLTWPSDLGRAEISVSGNYVLVALFGLGILTAAVVSELSRRWYREVRRADPERPSQTPTESG